MESESERDAGPAGDVVDHGPETFRDVVSRPAVYTLDVHTPEQRHIEGTDAFVPYDAIREHRDLLPDADTPIAVYCRSDGMSRDVLEVLSELGYGEIHHLRGGIRAWKDEGLPISEHRFGEPGVRPTDSPSSSR